MTDLPSNTRAPELDVSNALTVLGRHSQESGHGTPTDMEVTEDLIGLYLAYLVAVGWLPSPPTPADKTLPSVIFKAEQREAQAKVGGRAALA